MYSDMSDLETNSYGTRSTYTDTITKGKRNPRPIRIGLGTASAHTTARRDTIKPTPWNLNG